MSEIFGIMQAKLSEVELKVGTMGRSVDTVKNQRQAPQAEPSQQIDFVELQTEVKLIRQNAFEEKQRREIANNEHQVLISQLQQAIHQRENMMISQLKEARESSLAVMMAANDDRTNSEARTREFTDQNLGVFKAMLEGLEKQISEETESRR